MPINLGDKVIYTCTMVIQGHACELHVPHSTATHIPIYIYIYMCGTNIHLMHLDCVKHHMLFSLNDICLVTSNLIVP